ncbi:hypothetical protein GGS23DRAFT_156981 [Durotheca rogersii]|uniref:uncharacterized protein n=1 Tax=Durotheca rogersii TaxID=419775 RepID=UPI00221F3C62|nr:uncharacterized protein GGS23DRAFT_156981 [Durotheca rogersii]KAI5861175.1 hypothetical protein GGS23DRAFT_156981 [Durotheca rogersii]
MAATNNPLALPSDSPAARAPHVSSEALTVAGLKVDVYGLSELPPGAGAVSCLWLHHPRLRARGDMAPVAGQILDAYHQHQSGGGGVDRGLIAVAFDQRNHGSRLVDELANEVWRQGNKTHAQDMFGTISGAVVDTSHLLDVLEGHLFGAGHGPGAPSDPQQRRHIDHHLVLGVSLGGHSAWQLLFTDPRVTAGVMVIGCPDCMNLLQDRARLSRLQTYSAEDSGASFFGSRDFPGVLVGACRKYDPKGMLFGTGEIPEELTAAEKDRLRTLVSDKIGGKRLQVLSGGKDKLVPYRAGQNFMKFLADAAGTWLKHADIYLEDNVYPDAAHEFTVEMRDAATRFVLETVALKAKKDAASSRI